MQEKKSKVLMKINYLADILGVGLNEGTESSGFSPKKLFSMIKNSRQDNRGISSLKDSEENLHSGNVKKANLLSQSFHVYPHLSLGNFVSKISKMSFKKMFLKTSNLYVPQCRKSK